MRTLLTTILALIAISVSAQSITVDSSWVTNSSGVFFRNRLVTLSNGESTTTVKRLGDTTQVLNSYVDEIHEKTRTWATDVEVTSDYSRRIKELIRQDAPVLTLIGRSPMATILAPMDTALIDSVYRVKVDGTVRNLKFSLTAQGVFRYRVDTLTVRQVDYLGDVMRLNNWLNTGKALDLYHFKNGNWYDCTKSVQLYLKSVGAQARDASVPDIGAFDVVSAPIPILYDAGYAKIGDRWYKWVASKKSWAIVKAPKSPKPARL